MNYQCSSNMNSTVQKLRGNFQQKCSDLIHISFRVILKFLSDEVQSITFKVLSLNP